MPKYHVARSTVIDASPEEVFDKVADFGSWTSWSPWLCCEPDAKVAVSDDASSVGSTYQWSGELVGEGEIEHVKLERGKVIEDELRFIKPFKSLAKVRFDFEPSGGGTNLTWHMFGSLPWFLFWMKSSMDAFLGMDYERGLRMLKERVETGDLLSKTVIRGIEPIGPIRMIGARRSCKISEMGPSMEAALEQVCRGFDAAGIEKHGEVMSAYHKWDMKAKTCEHTSGMVVDGAVEPPAGLGLWTLDASRALCVEHTGRYEHLGNAWSAAHQYVRYKKLKQAKVAAFEIYKNRPDETDPGDLKTEVCLPLR